jgi:glycosyltransferase involved in cell wall biosynthesis
MNMDNKLRILEVCFGYGKGGLELYMLNIIKNLYERNHFTIGMAPYDSYIGQKISEMNVSFYPVYPFQRYLDFKIAKQITEIIKKNSIDIIHAHRSTDLSTLILAKRKVKSVKLIFTQQMESRRKKKDIFHRWIYKQIDGIITITNRIKKQVIQNTIIDPKKVFRLYYGIDTSKYKPDNEQSQFIRKEYGISKNDVVIGIVGRLEEGKGQHILLKAISLLKKLLPRIKIMIIGAETIGQSGYTEYLKQLVGKLNLANQVIFTGFHEDVYKITSALDIIVLATEKETFGLSLIECMAQEIAPIGTAAGGVPEIIIPGFNGILVPPLDENKLSGALEKLIIDEDYRKKISQNARETVQHKFGIENHLNNLEKIFFRVIKS